MTTLIKSDDVGGKTNLARITVYVEPEIKRKLETIAKAKKRTISNFVSVLIDEALNSEDSGEQGGDETDDGKASNENSDDSEE